MLLLRYNAITIINLNHWWLISVTSCTLTELKTYYLCWCYFQWVHIWLFASLSCHFYLHQSMGLPPRSVLSPYTSTAIFTTHPLYCSDNETFESGAFNMSTFPLPMIYLLYHSWWAHNCPFPSTYANWHAEFPQHFVFSLRFQHLQSMVSQDFWPTFHLNKQVWINNCTQN